jgi:hypothetical protein
MAEYMGGDLDFLRPPSVHNIRTLFDVFTKPDSVRAMCSYVGVIEIYESTHAGDSTTVSIN